MDHERVLIKYEEADQLWRIYWSGTKELADPRWFSSLEEAAAMARAIVFPEDEDPNAPRRDSS